MKGNIVFFRKNNSFISRITSKITNSEFTHVGLVVEFDEVTCIATIIESDKFVKTRIATTVIDENHEIYYVSNINNDERNMVIEYAFKQLGTRYDYLQILGLFISLLLKGDRLAFFNSSNKLICSELVDLAYIKSGIKRRDMIDIGNITPKELFDKYDLRRLDEK